MVIRENNALLSACGEDPGRQRSAWRHRSARSFNPLGVPHGHAEYPNPERRPPNQTMVPVDQIRRLRALRNCFGDYAPRLLMGGLLTFAGSLGTRSEPVPAPWPSLVWPDGAGRRCRKSAAAAGPWLAYQRLLVSQCGEVRPGSAPARRQVEDVPDRPERVDVAGLFAFFSGREHQLGRPPVAELVTVARKHVQDRALLAFRPFRVVVAVVVVVPRGQKPQLAPAAFPGEVADRAGSDFATTTRLSREAR